MEVEIIGVFVCFEQLLGEVAGLLAHGDRLHRQDVVGGELSLGSFKAVAIEIGDAVTIARPLPGQFKPSQDGFARFEPEGRV